VPVTAVIDPALGGVLTTADQTVSIQVPVGASDGPLSLSLSAVDPSAAANITINGQSFALVVVDDSGNPVTSFLQPLEVLVVPPPGTDPSALTISVLDPASGAFLAAQTQVTADGLVSVLVSDLAAPVAPQPASAAPPADATSPSDAPPAADATAAPDDAAAAAVSDASAPAAPPDAAN
jgi:hypothetical protein